MDPLSKTLQDILVAVVVAVVTTLGPILVKAVLDSNKLVKDKLDANVRVTLEWLVSLAVASADKNGLVKQVLEGAEDAARALAVQLQAQILAQYKISVNLTVIVDVVKAEVQRQYALLETSHMTGTLEGISEEGAAESGIASVNRGAFAPIDRSIVTKEVYRRADRIPAQLA